MKKLILKKERYEDGGNVRVQYCLIRGEQVPHPMGLAWIVNTLGECNRYDNYCSRNQSWLDSSLPKPSKVHRSFDDESKRLLEVMRARGKKLAEKEGRTYTEEGIEDIN